MVLFSEGLHEIGNRKSKIGFTLVELLVVVTIVAVLAALLTSALNEARGSLARPYDDREVAA